jgi:Domain of unknown function (DUF4287)
MSFQSYLDNIQAKTGHSPADFRRLAAEKGYLADGTLRPEIKAGAVIEWLKHDFDLGHGHAMAVVALLKGTKKEGDA